MKRLLTNNLLLKLVSVAAAILIWLLVIYNLNPMDTKTLQIPVTVLNAEKLEERGYAYDIVGDSKIEIQVKARRRDIGQITENDFKIEADLDYLQGDEENSMERRCQISHPIVVSNADIIEDYSKKSDDWITVILESIVTRNYRVEIEAMGTTADDFIFNKDNLTAVPKEVTITGRKSEVDRIYKVVYTVELQDANEEVIFKGKPRIEDSAHNDITDLIHVKMTPEEVTVCVEVYQKKTLKLVFETSGTPAAGYLLAGINCNYETIEVLGLKGMLSEIEEIVIPASDLSIEGLTASKEFKLKIKDYLPDRVEFANTDDQTGEGPTVIVSVDIEKKKQMQFRLDLKNISIIGRDFSKYTYSFGEEFIVVEVEGAAEDMNSLQVENIIGTLNLLGVGPGNYELDINLRLPEGIALKSRGRVHVLVEEIPEETTAPETEEETTAPEKPSGEETTKEQSGEEASADVDVRETIEGYDE